MISKPIISSIKYNNPVVSIDYTSNLIKVITKEGKVYHSNKAIVTIPLSILKKNYVSFYPSLPESKIDSLNNLNMDIGMKVFLRFKNAFWFDNMNSLYGGIYCSYYYSYIIDNNNFLVAYIVGSKCRSYVRNS